MNRCPDGVVEAPRRRPRWPRSSARRSSCSTGRATSSWTPRAAETGGVRSFHGQRLTKVATIPIRTAADLARTPYTDRTIARAQHLALEARAHGLRARRPRRRRLRHAELRPDRRPELTLGQLRRLGRRLALPEGWRYRTRRLKRELVLARRGSGDDHPGRPAEHLPARDDRRGRRAARAPRGEITGQTRNVTAADARARVEDRGTVTGTPFGDGSIVLVGDAGGRAPDRHVPAAVRARIGRRDGRHAVHDRGRPDQLPGHRALHRRDRRLPRHHERRRCRRATRTRSTARTAGCRRATPGTEGGRDDARR